MKRISALIFVALAFSLSTPNATANSVGLELATPPSAGTVAVNVVYDFTSFAMFGGGFDLVWDPDAIEFVSYTQAPLPIDAQADASPVGSLESNSLYSGAGIGTFDFINGMTSAGVIGTFVFNLLAVEVDTPCGLTLCLLGNVINPFVSLAGQEVTNDLLANGTTALSVTADPPQIPLPAAVWLMLSGIGVLFGLGGRHQAA